MRKKRSARRIVALDNLDDVLDQLVDMAAESSNLGSYNRKNPIDVDFRADRNVISVAGKFEKAAERALDEWVDKNPHALNEEYEASDLYDEDGPYNILMTLNGHGVGIWDGRWDHFFVDDRKSIKSLERHLEKKLGKFADSTGSGLLNQAIMDAAFEQDTEERGHDVDEDMDPEDYMSEPKTIARENLRKAGKRTAGKTHREKLDGDELIDELVGKVRGFDRMEGTTFWNDDGEPWEIDGLEVVTQILERIPFVRDVRESSGMMLNVTFDVDKFWSYMSGSGFRSSDYSEEDALDDLNHNAIGWLASAKSEYGIRVDPYDYQYEIEVEDEDDW